MTKRLFILLLLTFVAIYYKSDITLWLNKNFSFSYCAKPIKFYVANVDSKFGISKEKVISNVNRAANNWNQQYKNNLFEYDSEKGLPISLLYDERQRLLTSISENTDEIEAEKKDLDSIIKDFETQKAALTKKVNDLQDEIDSWNKKGGAPKDVYEKLNEQRDNLVKQIEDLNNKADEINKTTKNVNKEINGLNNTISNFNNLIEIKPEGGIFNGAENKIEIYFYDNEEQFVHIAMHELGHALGLDHTIGADSIMAPVISNSTKITIEDKQQLAEFCKPIGYIEYFKTLLTKTSVALNLAM